MNFSILENELSSLNGTPEQAPGRLFENKGERDVFIFFLEKIWQLMIAMDIQVISLEVDATFWGQSRKLFT